MQTPTWKEDISSPERIGYESKHLGFRHDYHFSHVAAQNLGCKVLECTAVKVARCVLRKVRHEAELWIA